MADYNVNMKQWNGTSFDNVLPLAYNAKQLEGQSLADVKQWVHDNGLLLYTGQYRGTGTFGASHPNSITVPFKPILWAPPIVGSSYTPNLFYISWLTNAYTDNYLSSYRNKIRLVGNTIQWYSEDAAADRQLNAKGIIYYFAVIGGYDMGGN